MNTLGMTHLLFRYPFGRVLQRPIAISSFVLTLVAMSLFSGCAGQSGGSSNGNNGGTISTAGSTTTMLLKSQSLYILDQEILKVLDLTQTPPQEVNRISVPDAETLFIYQDYLYIGGRVGVDIFDISSPASPAETSTYQHVRSCDPVIVDNDIGYITLRTTGRCGIARPNRLEIVDFTDPKFPELITQYDMPNPYGLAKTEDYLAICQERSGLALVDVSDTSNVNTIQTYEHIHCMDLIYDSNLLIATADDGIYQFFTGPVSLTELSRIPVWGPQNTNSSQSSSSSTSSSGMTL